MAKYRDIDPKPNVKRNIFGKPKTMYSYKMDEGGTNLVRMKTEAVKKLGRGKWAYETTTAPKQTPGKIKYSKARGGVKLSLVNKILGGGGSKSIASGNQNKRGKVIAEKRAAGNSVCSPNSTDSQCGPNAKGVKRNKRKTTN
jgi:hypothetical protein